MFIEFLYHIWLYNQPVLVFCSNNIYQFPKQGLIIIVESTQNDAAYWILRAINFSIRNPAYLTTDTSHVVHNIAIHMYLYTVAFISKSEFCSRTAAYSNWFTEIPLAVNSLIHNVIMHHDIESILLYITWSIRGRLFQKFRTTSKFITHVTLMTDGYCFSYVLEVAQCLCHFLEIFVFSFKSHTPVLDQRTTSIVLLWYIPLPYTLSILTTFSSKSKNAQGNVPLG